jgi:hypothetical protein
MLLIIGGNATAIVEVIADTRLGIDAQETD